MLNPTKIEWTRKPPYTAQGYTWNPANGCSGVGCAVKEDCYARRLAVRNKHRCRLCYEFKPHFHPERFNEPSERRKPSAIFLGSMGEFFDEANHWDPIITVLKVMRNCPQHRFYVLTKQPQNMKTYPVYSSNCWVGVSVNVKADLWRIDELRKVNASHRFISFEPLLECLEPDLKGIDWIIIGGRTGKHRFYPPQAWIATLFKKANEHNIPIFCKRNIAPLGVHIIQEFPKT